MLDPAGRASFTTGVLAVGSHHDITAAYGGDAIFDPSSGATILTQGFRK